ncbi:hypothetical protein ACFQY0_13575 [Haloferula chungangensis]|uniref:HEAT repeat domain-containing protein n=1 Tax=Haloferula chungangensis TaxID=1048331 RepID=A0ABW2LA46_9BACT
MIQVMLEVGTINRNFRVLFLAPVLMLTVPVRAEPEPAIGVREVSVEQTAERAVIDQINRAAGERGEFGRSLRWYSLVNQLSGDGIQSFLDDPSLLPTGREREELRGLLYLRWVELNPSQAISHLYQLSTENGEAPVHYALLEKLVEQWARINLEAVTDFVEQKEFREAAGLKELLLTRIALVWAETEVLAAMDWYQQEAGGRSEGLGLSMMVSQLATCDPARAAKLLERIPNGYARNLAVENLMTTWVRQDFPAARAWAESLPEGRKRRTALFICIRHWLKQDAAAVGDYLLSQLPSNDLQKELIREFAYGWAHRDPEAVLKWRNEVDDESLRNTLLSDLHIVWSDNDPRAAARYATGLSDEKTVAEILKRCGVVWGEQDHEAALQFAESLKAHPSYSAFVSGLIEGTARRDPQTAAELFSRFADEGVVNVRLGESLIRSWCGYDPEAAATWLLAMPDWMKQPGLRTLLESWSAEEPEEAQMWRESHGMK